MVGPVYILTKYVSFSTKSQSSLWILKCHMLVLSFFSCLYHTIVRHYSPKQTLKGLFSTNRSPAKIKRWSDYLSVLNPTIPGWDERSSGPFQNIFQESDHTILRTMLKRGHTLFTSYYFDPFWTPFKINFFFKGTDISGLSILSKV